MAAEHRIEASLPLVEEILAPWQGKIGVDFEGYKNHVYRMLHCCFVLHPCNERERTKLTIAACYHDIGMWPGRKADYLPPSLHEVSLYLQANDLGDWEDEIKTLIDLHHKIRPIKGELAERYPLAEIFRRADLADFSWGLFIGAVPRSYMRKLQKQFPDAGFHKMLAKEAVRWLIGHPFILPPFMKW